MTADRRKATIFCGWSVLKHGKVVAGQIGGIPAGFVGDDYGNDHLANAGFDGGVLSQRDAKEQGQN